MRPYSIWLLVGFFLFSSLPLAAQEPTDTSTWRVELKDGNEFVGYIIAEQEEFLEFKTLSLGVITIPRAEITALTPLTGAKIVEGELWLENLQAARYFWAPNGYGLRKGEGYYQNVWVLFNQVSFGVTDHFTIGFGAMPLFLFGGAPTPIWATPKFSVSITPDEFSIGGGALVGYILGEDGGGLGIVYGVTTLGNRDNNVSLGLGYGYAFGEWAQRPMINLSATLRGSRRTYFVTENYYFGNGGLISLGGRTVWSKISLDYGLVIPLGADIAAVIPWLGIAVPFQSRGIQQP